MKKVFLALIAAFVMTTAVQAQDNNNAQRNNRQRPDRTEMIQRRTDQVVKQYGLNAEQASKLLELNKEYADKMGPRMGGPRGGRRGQGPGRRPGGDRNTDGNTQATPQNAPQGAPQGAPNREEMEATMKAYNEALEKIMTPEQYKSYLADREKMRQQGPRRPRQQRQ